MNNENKDNQDSMETRLVLTGELATEFEGYKEDVNIPTNSTALYKLVADVLKDRIRRRELAPTVNNENVALGR